MDRYYDKTWRDEKLAQAYFAAIDSPALVEELETYDASGHRTLVTIVYSDFLKGTTRQIQIGDA